MLDALAQPGTVAVVSGQQVGLFLGPLFTIYKAATAIVVARALQAETGHACVPIFWLQTEDHDFAEIDHCLLPHAAGEPLRVALADPQQGHSHVPVAHRRLGASVASALDAIEAELATWPHTPELMALLRKNYQPESTLAEAFAPLLATLLREEGLVFLQPRDPAIAALAAPVHRKCLEDAGILSSLLEERAHALAADGFAAQVHIRPGSPLCFFAPDAQDGPRYRLDPDGESWRLAGHPEAGQVTHAEVLAWLDREPLRLSTSALSRPLLQDTLLPTAAYVGGPGEIAYFAQLAPAYKHFGLAMPLIVPRARFRVVDERTRGMLDKLGLGPNDLARPREDLVRALAQHAVSDFEAPEVVARRLTASLDAELETLSARMTALDPNFAKTVARTRAAVHEATDRLIDKYSRALGLRDHAALDRLDRARAFLQPGGAPQERVFGLPYFAARFGPREFVQCVLAACQPFSGKLEDLCP